MKRLSELSLSLFLFLLPWQTVWIIREKFSGGVKLQYEMLGFFATEIFLWIAIVSFLLWWYAEWKKQPRTPFAWSKDRVFALTALLFIVYAYLSSLWAPDPDIALQHALWIMEAFLLFFLLFLGALQEEKAWKWFALGSIFPCMLGIAQFLMQTAFASSLLGLAAHPAWEAGTSMIDAGNFGRWLRAYGPFAHPNLFGGYLVVAIIFTDQLLFKKNKLSVSCFLSAVSCLQWTALFFTFSRSAWLAAIIWVLFTAKQMKAHRLTLLTLLTLLTAIYYPLVQTRLFGRALPETRSITERTSGYREALALWREKPLIGMGAGNYTIAAQSAFPHRAPWDYQPVHNVLLLILVELGIVGIVLLFCLCTTYHLKPITYYLLPLLPLLIFDHYLWSSHAGLLLLPFFFIPNPSTEHPQNRA